MPQGGPRLRADDNKQNTVGERVAQRQRKLRLTQELLTARIAYVTEGGWNPTMKEVYRIEAGTRTVLDVELLALADALDCSACWLLTGQWEPRGEGSTFTPEPDAEAMWLYCAARHDSRSRSRCQSLIASLLSDLAPAESVRR